MNKKYGEIQLATYEVSRNHEKPKPEKFFEINILGKIENIEYPIHFIIEKPIEEYLKMTKYKSFSIESKHF